MAWWDILKYLSHKGTKYTKENLAAFVSWWDILKYLSHQGTKYTEKKLCFLSALVGKWLFKLNL